uniref:Uncharacterized protein n=1 Tax=Ciona savignyi TaxID=51511 RepID=H2YKJ2_CIOSA
PRSPNTSTTFSYPLITPVNPATQEPRLNEQASPLDFSIGAKFVNETLQHAPTSQEPFNTSRLEKKEEISRELNDILQSIQSTSARQVNAPFRKQSILTQSNSNWNNNGPAVTPLNCNVAREAPTANSLGGSASSSEHGLGHELNPIRVVDHTMPPCLLPGAKLHNGSVVFVQNADGTKSVIKLQPDEPELTINDVYSLSNMEGSDVISVDTMRETELNTNPASPVESEQEAMNLKIRNKKRSSPDLQKVVERLKKRVTGLK